MWNGLTHQLNITVPFSASMKTNLKIKEASWNFLAHHPDVTLLVNLNWATWNWATVENASAWHQTNQNPMGLQPNPGLTKHQKQRSDILDHSYGTLTEAHPLASK